MYIFILTTLAVMKYPVYISSKTHCKLYECVVVGTEEHMFSMIIYVCSSARTAQMFLRGWMCNLKLTLKSARVATHFISQSTSGQFLH